MWPSWNLKQRSPVLMRSLIILIWIDSIIMILVFSSLLFSVLPVLCLSVQKETALSCSNYCYVIKQEYPPVIICPCPNGSNFFFLFLFLFKQTHCINTKHYIASKNPTVFSLWKFPSDCKWLQWFIVLAFLFFQLVSSLICLPSFFNY